MTSSPNHIPLLATMAGLHRFTVDEYHQLFEVGVLAEDERIELIEGYLINKLPHTPPHACTVGLVSDALNAHIPAGWFVRLQHSFALGDSEPEPDLLLVRGTPRSYMARRPGPSDAGLVIEVAEASLIGDRADKGRIYARAGIGCYWIVNVVDGQIEVYTSPSGPTAAPAYAQRQDYHPGSSIPLILNGIQIATFLVQELLP